MDDEREKVIENYLENVYEKVGELLMEVMSLQEYISGVKTILKIKNNGGKKNEQERINTG